MRLNTVLPVGTLLALTFAAVGIAMVFAIG